MYQLFNILAWIWLVATGVMLLFGGIKTVKQFFTGWPRGWQYKITPMSKLYGTMWIPFTIACVVALTVPFDPTLQFWVVVLSVSAMVLKAFNIFMIKVVNY